MTNKYAVALICGLWPVILLLKSGTIIENPVATYLFKATFAFSITLIIIMAVIDLAIYLWRTYHG
jgi:type III secretory pathway component EscS